MKKKWVRELILLPKTLTGKRRYNKTEDYGVFKKNNCVISHLEQSSYIVTDIEESKKWFGNIYEGRYGTGVRSTSNDQYMVD